MARKPAEEPGESSEAVSADEPRPVPDARSGGRPAEPAEKTPDARSGAAAATPEASAHPAVESSEERPAAGAGDAPGDPAAERETVGAGEPADVPSGVSEGPHDASRRDGADRPARPRRPVGAVTAVAVAASVVAAGFAAYYGWSWYRAAHDESLRFSRARDAVVRAADQGVQNLNTLDYRKADEGFTTWEQSSTGPLHDQLVQGRAQFEEQVRQARTVTTAKILEAAVTDLDTRTGKAGVIVALQITVTPENGQPTTKPSRMRAQLTRTSAGWKLSALGQAPVGTTGSAG